MGYEITQSYTETDLELLIVGGESPHTLIEVFVPGDQKYDLGQDYESLQELQMKLQENFGVGRIGSISIVLKNNDFRYLDSHASSIFYGKQVIKDWLRVRTGWGVTYSSDVATQFQGKIKRIEVDQDRKARILVYDAWQDILDQELNASLTLDSTVVPTMTPMDIVEYLVDTQFGVTWFDMDTLTSSTIIDQDTLDAANVITRGITIESTTWAAGTKLSEMLQDLIKICGGYLYIGKNGKLYTYINAPSITDPASNVVFTGNETAAVRHILESRRFKDLSKIINVVTWTYGSDGAKRVSAANSASQALYGIKSLDLTTKWNCNALDLDAMASRMVRRYKDPIEGYLLTITWLNDGEGLAITLGDEIAITDDSLDETSKVVQVFEIRSNPQRQLGRFTCEAARTAGKYCFTCSDDDEGDGYGVTADNWDNWIYRFGYFGDEDTGFPGKVGTDAWGNEAEDIFILW